MKQNIQRSKNGLNEVWFRTLKIEPLPIYYLPESFFITELMTFSITTKEMMLVCPSGIKTEEDLSSSMHLNDGFLTFFKALRLERIFPRRSERSERSLISLVAIRKNGRKSCCGERSELLKK